MNCISKKPSLSQSKQKEQYDLDNNYIKTWQSSHEAGSELNINSGNILRCCNNKIKTAYKHIWKFKNDPNLPNETWHELTDDNDLKSLFISNLGRYCTKKINKSYGSNNNDNHYH